MPNDLRIGVRIRYPSRPRTTRKFASKRFDSGIGIVAIDLQTIVFIVFLAERVGFEPTDPLRDLLISSQARSAKLRHLSAEGTQFNRKPGNA